MAKAKKAHEGTKILIIDDEKKILEMLVIFLRNEGFQAVTAPNAREGLKQLEERAFDVVLTDIMMPEMDGLQLLAEIKKRFPEVSVVMMTAHGTMETAVESLRAGAADYIQKPFEFKDVGLTLHRVLERRQLSELVTLYETGLAVIGTRNRRALLPRIVEVAIQTLRADHASLWLTDEEGKLKKAYAHELTGGRAETKWPQEIEEKMALRVAELGTPTLLPARESDPRLEELVKSHPAHSCLIYPLKKEQKLIGVLSIDRVNITDPFRTHDLQRLTVLASIFLLSYENAQLIAELQDRITELINTQTELKESESLVRQVIDLNPCCIYVKGGDGRYIMANEAMADLYGTTPAEMEGKSDDDFAAKGILSKEDAALIAAEEKKVIQQGEAQLLPEWAASRDDKGTRWFQQVAAPLSLPSQKDCILGVAIDISERKEADEQRIKMEALVMQAQKIEAMEILVGSITHDFQNILGGIIGFVELAKIEIDTPEAALKNLDDTIQMAKKASGLVQQLFTFSRQTEPEFKPIHLSTAVEQALAKVQKSLPPKIELLRELTSVEARIWGDVSQIQQAIWKLCDNAVEAMQERGGTLTIRLEGFSIDPSVTAQYFNLPAGAYEKLTVSDTGRGMTEYQQDRMFDPFFTTKERSEGKGLGLSIVHGIVKSHRGAMMVDSAIGTGSVFHMFLPIIPSSRASTGDFTAVLPVGNERILLVDDDPTQVAITSRILQHLGYSVSSHASAEEALVMIKQSPDKIDLVITDQIMPGMGGVELSRVLHQLDPKLPIILATGFCETITEATAQSCGILCRINKPLVAGELAAAIRKVLAMA